MARNPLLVRRVSFLLVAVFATLALQAGIDKRLQNHYLKRYLNKTIFLRVLRGRTAVAFQSRS